MKKELILPKFRNEQEEWSFWDNINLADYYEPSDARRIVFPNLKPTTRSISIRMPEFLIDRIKERANKLNVPYQSLIKIELKKVFL